MTKLTPHERHEYWLLTGHEAPEDDGGLWWWFWVPVGLLLLALLLDGAQL